MQAYVLCFAAGLLTALSPCVLPMLPLVLAGAGARSPFGPAALVAGLVISSAAMALLVAGLGRLVGFDGALLRALAATMLVLSGALIAVPPLLSAVSEVASPLTSWAARVSGAKADGGLSAQVLVGALTGLVWSPCIGPTVGAAGALVMQAHTALAGGLQLLLFSVGAALPMLALAYGARATILRRRTSLMHVTARFKPLIGTLLIVTGVAALTGADHLAEAWLVSHSPAWLTTLTTAI